MILCRTLGPVEITIGGRAAPPELLWRRHLALLVYLARSPKHARTRDHLVGLLWPDKPDQAARHSLREAVRILRRCLGEEAVETPGQQVRLRTADLELDVELLETRAAAGDWKGASELIAGEFMEGFAVPGATDLEDWLGTERLLWRERAIDVLAHFAGDLSRAGRNFEAADAARRALALDPLSDVAVRLAMRGAALLGDRRGALELYDAFRTRMQSATGATPQTETEHLAERIRAERLPARPPRGAEPAGAESRRAPLVGRAATLHGLCTVWDEVREGSGAALIVLEGDLGFGKSRLMEELVNRARLDGASVSVVRVVEGDAGEPHAGLLGLASGLGSAPGVAGAKSQSVGAFAAELPEWADRFPPAGADEVLALPRAFRDVVVAAAEERPVVLALDDAHWLDAASLQALEAVLRDLAAGRLLLVLTVTRHDTVDAIDRLRSQIGRETRGVAVSLDPLSPEDIRALARWALPDYSDDQIERVSRRVAVDSAGLPLLAVELLHAIALGLDLAATPGGAWPAPLRTLDETLPGDLPDAVVAAVRIGYRRLSDHAQRVLAAAAVLGGRVDPARLAQACELSAETVANALDELEWQRWIEAEPRGYSFIARLVRDIIARDMLTAGQRQRLLERADGDHQVSQ